MTKQSIPHEPGGTKTGNTCIIIDFMVVIISIQKQFFPKTFKDLLHNVIYNAKRVIFPKMIHFVFDSYIELTIKDLERCKRGIHVTYEVAYIYPCTGRPSMIDSFWESNSKKRKLIDSAFEYYLEHPMKTELAIVYSEYPIPKANML